MDWSIKLSLRASIYCVAPVVVRESDRLPDSYLGSTRYLWFLQTYIILVKHRDDMATFRHEVWHVRLMDWSRHETKKPPLLRLRETCRKVADNDPFLSNLLRDVYDETLGVDALDEPVVRLIERPDLYALLPREELDLLLRLQRPAWLDLRTYWFHWFVILAFVHWAVFSV